MKNKKKLPKEYLNFSKPVFTILFIAFFSLAVIPGILLNVEAGPVWQKINEINGITVYSRKVPGVSLLALKGETIVDAPIEKVAAVMDEVERHHEWIPYLTEAKELKHHSFFKRLVYSHSRSPWPAKDREFLTLSTLEVDRKARRITVKLESVKDPAAPERKDRVRGYFGECIFILESMDDPSKTWFSTEMLVDPKGWLPDWLVNLIQKKWTRKYIEGLKSQVAKPGVKDHPEVKKLFSKKEKHVRSVGGEIRIEENKAFRSSSDS